MRNMHHISDGNQESVSGKDNTGQISRADAMMPDSSTCTGVRRAAEQNGTRGFIHQIGV